MELVIHSMGMPFNGDTLKTKSLGGSESAGYYLAKEMAARGHRVSVFTNERKEGKFDGVNYCWSGEATPQHPLGDRFEFYATRTPHDVCLVQRHQLGFHKTLAAKVCIHQMHDLALHRNAQVIIEGAWQVDAFTCVSEWHRKQLLGVYGLNPDSVHVLRNAVDPTLYAEVTDFVMRGDKPGLFVGTDEKPHLVVRQGDFNMLYQSRPERGLEHLVRPGGIMAQLAKTTPNARLFVCAYDNTVPQMQSFYGQLLAWGSMLPNVTLIGSFDKPSLAQAQMAMDLLLYPGEFDEVSCITAIEAMHAGLPMLCSDVGALSETCKDSGTTLLPLAGKLADEKAFLRWIERRAKGPDDWWPKKHDKQLEAAKSRTWSVVADDFERLVNVLFDKRKSAGAMARHLLDHSDVSALDEYLDRLDYGDDRLVTSVVAEREKLYGFIENPETYKAHYLEWQAKYYAENPNLLAQGEDCTGTSRFRHVHMYMAEAFDQYKARMDVLREEHAKRVTAYLEAPAVERPAMAVGDGLVHSTEELDGQIEDPGEFVAPRMRVLDFGCAHGHYTIPLAEMFEPVEFVGMDISPDAVNVALRWADRQKLKNAQFVLGTQADLGDLAGEFDLIIAAEVVEHVYDWRGLLQDLGTKLAPGGALLLTTPCGRWEWNGIETESYWKGREHVHHFEYADLQEIFKGSDLKLTYAPAGQDLAGTQLGSWVAYVTPKRHSDAGEVRWGNQLTLGSIDYARKFKYTAPRQTVSACMIVKDAENMLRRCVSTYAKAVDEIVFAVDPKTTDRTREVIEQLKREFWFRPITVIEGYEALNPATGGFAGARNRSLEPAAGDWRFWCDADEELRPAFGLWRYLRNNGINGIGFPQVHYSAMPAQVLTTDYPTRLFRSDCEAEFYGYVHEHPETKMGEGITYSAVRGDVQLLHSGYVDEPTRRARFMRNYPLMVKDLQENPGRKLNKFLMLRDVAQSLAFQLETTGFQLVPGQRERALEGIKLFEEVVQWNVPRMIVDGLQYYSLCVEIAYGGFDAAVHLQVSRPDAPAMASDLQLRGRWHSRDFYFGLTRKLQEETTKHYESPYA